MSRERVWYYGLMKIRRIARKAAAAIEMSHIFFVYVHLARGRFAVLKSCETFLLDRPKRRVMME